MEYEAPARVLLVSVATPELFKVPVPSFPSFASVKVTVPVGVLVEVVDGFTVAVRVTLVPAITGDAGEMVNVVVVATVVESQFVSRFATLMEPRPVASSYPAVTR
jgi:uncharacterized membrane protein YdfJ with MMPL/SSD domain